MRWRADLRIVVVPDGGRPHGVAPTERWVWLPFSHPGREYSRALYRATERAGQGGRIIERTLRVTVQDRSWAAPCPYGW